MKAGANTRGILFAGATAGIAEDSGTAMFLYRPVVQPDQYVDVGLGVRAWGIGGNIALNQGALLPSASVASRLSWADPLIGVRYRRDLGNGFGATAYGDVGGFGIGAHIDWQLIDTIDYPLNSWVDLHGGFRSLSYSFGVDRVNLKASPLRPDPLGHFPVLTQAIDHPSKILRVRHVSYGNAGTAAAGRGTARGSLAAMGPISERTPMGHRA